MQAGELNRRITIQRNTSNGSSSDVWRTFATVWAKKKGASGRLFYQAAAAQSKNDVVFTIRYKRGINTEMRIIENGDTAHPYKITAEPIDPNNSRQWLEIHAQRTD
ncbi:MAG: phage head closure protein [Clostridia bacterium]|jgi:SPP1 family predicted phage head-tail adaptor|nr:phage head closure protein [Clostridia bacterium]